MTDPRAGQWPAFVNAQAGSAEKAHSALAAAPAFAEQAVEPDALSDAIGKAVEAGTPRILIAGGDGTIATAAAILAGTDTAMAILPGGTLNHFARDLGIPTDPEPALALATTGRAARVDVAYANDRLFLNTSSLGAYVRFVRMRDGLESKLGYHLASLVAGVRVLAGLRTYRVTLTVEGQERTYRTPVVFVGVGERELKLPTMGGRVKNGRRGLHVIVIQGSAVRQVLRVALLALFGGVRRAARTEWLDSFLVEECRIEQRHRGHVVAVDGEVIDLAPPLHYRLARDALLVVQPEPGAGDEAKP